MKDCIGKEVKENDLVVKSIPDRSGAHMTLGIIKGKSVYYSKGIFGGVSRCNITNVYVIQNPTKKELKIKETLINLYKNKNKNK